MSTYGAITTNIYKAREAAHAAGGPPVVFTTFAVGDGGGVVPALSNQAVGLVHEVYRASVNGVSVNANNASQIDIQCVIPNAAGTFNVREIMVLDADGAQLVAAIANIVKTTQTDGQVSDFNLTVSIVIADASAVVITSSDSAFATETEIIALEADVADLLAAVANSYAQLSAERMARDAQKIVNDRTQRDLAYVRSVLKI